MHTPFSLWMNFLYVQMVCIAELYDSKFLHCNNFMCLVCFCMFLTRSASYCLVTASRIYGMFICMYVLILQNPYILGAGIAQSV